MTVQDSTIEEQVSSNPELDAFKRKVVVVAMDEAASRGWCSVVEHEILVDRLDLADYFPPSLSIQTLMRDGSNWALYDLINTYSDAVDDSIVDDAIRRAKGYWQNTIRNMQFTPGPTTLQFGVDEDTNPEDIAKKVADYQATIGKPQSLSQLFPRYRVTLGNRDGDNVEIKWTCEEDFADEAPAQPAEEPQTAGAF